jgi:hypothetical protein
VRTSASPSAFIGYGTDFEALEPAADRQTFVAIL